MKKTGFHGIVLLLLLLPASPAFAVTSTWTGLGADTKWTTSNNWNGGFLPSAGNILEFPAGAAQTANLNDLAAGTDFEFLAFTGASGGYVLGGTFIDLNSGVLAGQGSGTNEIDFNIVLLQDQIWVVSSADAQLTVGSTVVDLAGHDLTFDGAGTFAFSATLSDTGSGADGNLIKNGPGILTLEENQTFFSSALFVNEGTLNLSNGLTNGTGNGETILGAGTLLTGTGRAGGLLLALSGSRIAPGGSPGTLTVADLVMDAGSTLALELNGTAAGSEYDQLSVFLGDVTLQGPALVFSLGFSPNVGDVFTIIDNDDSDPISGEFADLPEGTVFTQDGVDLKISYVGGTGNDVTLTVEPPVSNDGDSPSDPVPSDPAPSDPAPSDPEAPGTTGGSSAETPSSGGCSLVR